MLRVGWIVCTVCTAGVIVACTSTAALAHPNYERLERVMMDDRGRELRLVLSHTDGIGLSDPVKLVIRDPDHHTIAETGWARTISVICARPAACVVFAYEMFAPMPSHIWWVSNGQLAATHSTWLAVLGVVAPFWSDAWGYVVAIGFLLLPWPVLAIVWRFGNAAPPEASTRSLATIARQMAVVAGFVGSAFYYLICAWVLAMLAELSPLLAIGSALAVWGTIALSLRAGREQEPASA